MEDEGRISDHTAGIAATDGSWHHIAVTWSSHDGLATLYDNGHKVRPAPTNHALRDLLVQALRTHWSKPQRECASATSEQHSHATIVCA